MQLTDTLLILFVCGFLMSPENIMSKKKTTTPKQYEQLISFMKTNESLARGFLQTKDGKTNARNLWENIANELNALGPPVRNYEGWKKVWSDYKFHIKGKLQHNKKELAATGGGPCKLVHFSPLEEAVIELLNLRSAVEGVKGDAFGGQTQAVLNETSAPNTSTNSVSNSGEISQINICDVENIENIEILGSDTNAKTNVHSNVNGTRTRRSRTISGNPERIALLEKQSNTQEVFFADIIKMLKQIDDNSKESLKYIKRQYYLNEKAFQLDKDKFEFFKKKHIDDLKLQMSVLEVRKLALEVEKDKMEFKKLWGPKKSSDSN